MPIASEHDTFSKSEYERLRAALDMTPNGWMNSVTVVMNMTLVALALHLLTRGSAPAYWMAQLILPVAFFQGFSLLHDCGHGSCTSSRLGNTVIGHYASVLCFMPFFPWKYVHTEHHVWAGNADRDPGLALVKRARDTGKLPMLIAVAWRSWIPIGAFAQHLVYWSYPIVALRRGKLPRKKLINCAASVALLICVYSALHLFTPQLFNALNFAPAILLYLLLVEFVNTPHHAGLTAYRERLPLWKQHLPTRSCSYPPIISAFAVLNFNFHIEHHFFPNLPWYRLPGASRLVKAALGPAYRETRGLNWHLAERKRDFVGVLTGGSEAAVAVPRNLDAAASGPDDAR